MEKAQLKRRCVIPGCGLETKPPRLLCIGHWHHVPPHARKLLDRCYVAGQEMSKAPPNPGWCTALAVAVWFATFRPDGDEGVAAMAVADCIIGFLEEMGWVQEVELLDGDPHMRLDLGRGAG